jgi:hypothetical protein
MGERSYSDRQKGDVYSARASGSRILRSLSPPEFREKTWQNTFVVTAASCDHRQLFEHTVHVSTHAE